MESISGTSVCIGNRILPSAPRVLSDKQLANVVHALRAGLPVRLDGNMLALPEGHAGIFLHNRPPYGDADYSKDRFALEIGEIYPRAGRGRPAQSSAAYSVHRADTQFFCSLIPICV